MPLKLNPLWIVISAMVVFLSASCSPQQGLPATEEVNTAMPSQTTSPAPSQPILKTDMGDLMIVSARLVDEVHDSKAPSGNKFLLIGLAQPNSQKLVPGEFSLETFQNMMMDNQEQIYILGKDDSQSYYSQMGGWVEDDFVIGFTVPLVESYTLYWPENAPIPLNVEQ